MANDGLAGHPLVRLALENLRPLLKRAEVGLLKLAEKGQVRSEDDTTLPEHEFYDQDVFRKAGALVDAFDRLEQSQRLIETAPEAALHGAGLDRHTWIEYHYSYYLITIVSLADVALVLANGVFRLGNRERDCKQDLISRNWWVAQTPVKGALEGLAKLTRPHKEGRNRHVHWGRLQPIAEVMESKLLDQLKLYSFLQRVGKPVVASSILDQAYRLEITKISGTLDLERAQIEGGIVALFDALFPIYKSRSEELHQSWRRGMETTGEPAERK